MAGDDYVAAAGGALKLKGLGAGGRVAKKKKKRTKAKKTEAELAAAADREKAPSHEADADDDADDAAAPPPKTESERRYDEARKKRLLQMAGPSASKPELLKTHKERVEGLNTYLSKLSEHHDMPKIGPG